MEGLETVKVIGKGSGGVVQLVRLVAVAYWISKLSSSCLLKALADYPDHGVKVRAICLMCL